MYGKYNMKGHVEMLIQHEAKPSAVFASKHPPSAVFFIHTSRGVPIIGSAKISAIDMVIFTNIGIGCRTAGGPISLPIFIQ